MKKMRICAVCGSYTMKESHCNMASLSAHPAAFTSRDRYGTYRRRARYGTK